MAWVALTGLAVRVFRCRAEEITIYKNGAAFNVRSDRTRTGHRTCHLASPDARALHEATRTPRGVCLASPSAGRASSVRVVAARNRRTRRADAAAPGRYTYKAVVGRIVYIYNKIIF